MVAEGFDEPFPFPVDGALRMADDCMCGALPPCSLLLVGMRGLGTDDEMLGGGCEGGGGMPGGGPGGTPNLPRGGGGAWLKRGGGGWVEYMGIPGGGPGGGPGGTNWPSLCCCLSLLTGSCSSFSSSLRSSSLSSDPGCTKTKETDRKKRNKTKKNKKENNGSQLE